MIKAVQFADISDKTGSSSHGIILHFCVVIFALINYSIDEAMPLQARGLTKFRTQCRMTLLYSAQNQIQIQTNRLLHV